MLKKINAVLAFVTAVLTFSHVTTMGLLMLGVIPFSALFTTMGKLLLLVFTVHIVISLIIMFFLLGDDSNLKNFKKSTIEQRIASILLLVFIHFHMDNYAFVTSSAKPTVFGFVTEILFAVIIMCHYMPSIDKGLDTLKINKKPIVILCKGFAVMAFVFSLITISKFFISYFIA